MDIAVEAHIVHTHTHFGRSLGTINVYYWSITVELFGLFSIPLELFIQTPTGLTRKKGNRMICLRAVRTKDIHRRLVLASLQDRADRRKKGPCISKPNFTDDFQK